MKTALIYAIPSTTKTEFEWKWRCDAENVSSSRSFVFYYDCLTDAVTHGYRVEMTQAQGATAPGGAGYALGSQENS